MSLVISLVLAFAALLLEIRLHRLLAQFSTSRWLPLAVVALSALVALGPMISPYMTGRLTPATAAGWLALVAMLSYGVAASILSRLKP